MVSINGMAMPIIRSKAPRAVLMLLSAVAVAPVADRRSTHILSSIATVSASERGSFVIRSIPKGR